MFRGKPIIGLAGGIGSGKSFVGEIFAELGCMVINSDALVREAYHDNKIKVVLREWWGDSVFAPDGEISRVAISQKIFDSDNDRRRLESILHPRVSQLRQSRMETGASDAKVLAFVWDSPLLFETGLSADCDAVVYVEATDALRMSRARQSRGWDSAEMARRENSQMPLDKKRAMSHYVVVNITDAESTRVQVRELLSTILAGPSR